MSTIFGGISVETPKFTVLKQLAGLNGAELRKYAPQVRAEVLYDSAPNDAIMNNLNSPFRVLAGYIFGGNTSRSRESSEKVEMTAPVVMQKGPAAEKIAMTAPVVMQTGPTAPTTGTTPSGPAADTAAAAAAGSSASAEGAATPGAEGAGSGSPTTSTGSSQRVMSFIMPSKYTSVADLPVPKDARVQVVEVPERTYAAVCFRGSMTQAVAAAREAELRAAAEREGIKLSADPNAVQYCSYNPPWCLPWLRTNDILVPVADE